MKCLVCDFDNRLLVTRNTVNYTRCENCGSITTETVIRDLIETENDNSSDRNSTSNNLARLARLDSALGRKPLRVLDYGCGNGELVALMKSQGIEAQGIDHGTMYDLLEIPKDSLDAITMIEVIEHLYQPSITLELLSRFLKVGGVIMIETTFADSIQDMTTSPYVDPKIGHVCILSRLGLMNVLPSGLEFEKSINPHVVILRKV